MGLHPAAKKKGGVQAEKSCAIAGLSNRLVTLRLAPLCLSAHLGSSQKTGTAHSIWWTKSLFIQGEKMHVNIATLAQK